MCGIVGAIAKRDVVPLLVDGLRRLEYRGYDSAGVAVFNASAGLERRRAAGKVRELDAAIAANPIHGNLGIAHTRWATHGSPTENNAHPHFSEEGVALVHNGIIENYEGLRDQLMADGYQFHSETDTEVVAHLIHVQVKQGLDLLAAVQAAMRQLHGAFALAVMSRHEPERLIVARQGCPVVLGEGEGEMYVASDVQALLAHTRSFRFLDDGDVAELSTGGLRIFDHTGAAVTRALRESELNADAVELGVYQHYMQKEIFEQPRAVADTLSERIANGEVLTAALGPRASAILPQVKGVHIVACGTSYHAGLVARYYLEQGTQIPCVVEVASEYRYRHPVVPEGTLFLAISQSGETADTLAAMRYAKRNGYLATAAICNVPESSVVREADMVLMTRAGPEIGVASTKAFTTQLAALALVGLLVAKHRQVSSLVQRALIRQLLHTPEQIEKTLLLEDRIKQWAVHFKDKDHALFLGRGPSYPVAMEGALKLKEITYIHAEAYAAGELKHGPLALVDEGMPVVAVAPNNALLDKLSANLQEVRARGGRLFVLADPNTGLTSSEGIDVITMPEHIEVLQAPLMYSIPLQLLAYHTALLRGTDVDQPRNLAKSVTVE